MLNHLAHSPAIEANLVHAGSMKDIPLCVDLDGTLLQTDTLHESVLLLFKNKPLLLARIPGWLLVGRAHLKWEVSRCVGLDVSLLPVHAEFLEYLKSEHSGGRKLILVTAADASVGNAVAERFGFFNQVISSDGETNLSGRKKATALEQRFGNKNFDYAGNEQADLPVWAAARRAIVVAPNARTLRQARSQGNVEKIFERPGGIPRLMLRALRIHQWAKNLLLFIPLLGAHRWNDPAKLRTVLLAFAAFCLCASSVYLLNDLLDLEADRYHPTKRSRPFASGRLSLKWGVFGAPLFLIAGILLALLMSWEFAVTFALYYCLTLGYSLRFKQVAIVDVFVLTSLYGIRVLAGGYAAQVPVSDWLLVFSLFLFLSLAFAKRFTELKAVQQGNSEKLKGRGYQIGDEELVSSMGVGSGYLAVLVLALYITNPLVTQLYQRPSSLLLACPLMLYWISRVWFLAHRHLLHADPIVFALTDRQSWLICAVILLIGMAALPR